MNKNDTHAELEEMARHRLKYMEKLMQWLDHEEERQKMKGHQKFTKGKVGSLES